jgi:hypothetical protein
MQQCTRFIVMDVHKDTIVVAVTASGDVGKATAYGTFPNTAAALRNWRGVCARPAAGR